MLNKFHLEKYECIYLFYSINYLNICKRTCEESHVEISTNVPKSVEVFTLCIVKKYEPLDVTEHVPKVEQNVLDYISLHSEVYGIFLFVCGFS